MKSHYVLLRKILQELGDWCGTSTTHDWKTIMRRVEHEGQSFVTIVLPQFSKDLERALALGGIDSTLFLGFKRRGCLPTFLSGFTSQVFNAHTGTLLNEPSVAAIYSIRQICNLLGKMEMPCSDARQAAAFRQYIETDKGLAHTMSGLSPSLLEEFQDVAQRLWLDVLLEMDESIFNMDIVPKHGPGATADRISGNAKFCQQQWTQRLEECFPFGDFILPNWRHYDATAIELLVPEAEIPTRVISVPKTQKTPRIIAIEPTAVQYVQQGLMERLVTIIERHDSLSMIVGFKDQTLNQQLAREGSLTGHLSTLDLSEASDRVSWPLVQALCGNRNLTREALDATRSRTADVPGHGIHTLFKYASMGSALCFPIEAMVFTTIIFMGIERVLGYRVCSRTSLRKYVGKVRVYGDDIIIPTEFVPIVTMLLSDFGLKVNVNKSFWTGKFRESCGKEYYDGKDVSYIKCRQLLPTSRQHVTEIVSTVSLRNQLFKAGFVDTVEWLDNIIERLIPFPEVEETSPALGKHTWGPVQGTRMCPFLQRPLVKAAVVEGRLPVSILDDKFALLKFFLKRGDEPRDKNHLKRAGRPDSLTLKIRWVPTR